MLFQVLRDFLVNYGRSKRVTAERPRVLNVGGGDRSIAIPHHYDGWQHLLLDIDQRRKPDIVCDARNLATLNPAQFDAIYCSHNLEHYYRHDAMKVLAGFRHVLKARGFVEIRVPDLQSVLREVSKRGLDLDDVLYQSAVGPIAVLDVIYGLGREIESSGNDFYAHKSGFTAKVLNETLQRAGFPFIYISTTPEIFELRALSFTSPPTPDQSRLLELARVPASVAR